MPRYFVSEFWHDGRELVEAGCWVDPSTYNSKRMHPALCRILESFESQGYLPDHGEKIWAGGRAYRIDGIDAGRLDSVIFFFRRPWVAHGE